MMMKELILIEMYNRKIYETIDCLSRKNTKYYNYILLGNINIYKNKLNQLEMKICGLSYIKKR